MSTTKIEKGNKDKTKKHHNIMQQKINEIMP